LVQDETDVWTDLNLRGKAKYPVEQLRIDHVLAYKDFLRRHTADIEDPYLIDQIEKLSEILYEDESSDIVKSLDSFSQVRQILRDCRENKHVTRIDKRID
jgi:ubiquinone biosynthesis protein Coq4